MARSVCHTHRLALHERLGALGEELEKSVARGEHLPPLGRPDTQREGGG
jgi:hypothetical protein